MSEAAKQRERFNKRVLAWKSRTGNKIFHGIRDDKRTRQAALHMAHKPYGHYDEMVDTAEPERYTGWG